MEIEIHDNDIRIDIFRTILLVFAFVILLIGLTRAIQALLELATTWERAVYLSYLILGALFCLASVILFKKRNTAAS